MFHILRATCLLPTIYMYITLQVPRFSTSHSLVPAILSLRFNIYSVGFCISLVLTTPQSLSSYNVFVYISCNEFKLKNLIFVYSIKIRLATIRASLLSHYIYLLSISCYGFESNYLIFVYNIPIQLITVISQTIISLY